MPAAHLFASVEERLIHTTPITGPRFVRDASRVHKIIRGFVITTPSWTWIEPVDSLGNGRITITNLRAHHDGPAAKLKRIALAESGIKNLHYRNESALKFESFVTKVSSAFNTLEQEGSQLF